MFLPPAEEIPEGSHRVIGFNFPGLAVLGTASLQEAVTDGDFVAYALTASIVIGGKTVPPSGFGLMLYHGHNGVQRQLYEKQMPGGLVCGTGSNPAYMSSPYLFAKGDTITCEVSNTWYSAGGGEIIPVIIVNGKPWGGGGIVPVFVTYEPIDLYISIWGVQPDE
jgi:hypothetical protein